MSEIVFFIMLPFFSAESDDTDDVAMGSHDLFESQSSSGSQPHIVSVSQAQFAPTLQLSGDLALSQGYERFLPSRYVLSQWFHPVKFLIYF